MKIIHCSDLHLDSEMNGLSKEKSRIRREESLRTFERMVDFAVQNNVEVIIIAGDLFDQNKYSLKTASRVIRIITANNNIDFLYLAGNHDEDGFYQGLLQEKEKPSNLKLFGKDLTSYIYGDVCICGIDGSASFDGYFYENIKLNDNLVNILCMHGQVAGYKTDKDTEVISLPKLKDKNIDYLALGHYHSYTVGEIDLRGKYVYSGCLEGRGFDETGEKGFVLLNVENGKLNFEFIKFAYRSIYEHSFSVDNYTDWLVAEQDLISQLKNKYNTNSIIKVVINGERRLDFYMDINSLQNRLNEIFFYVKIQDKTSLKVDVSDFENDKSVKGEFVRAVLQSNLSDEDKKKVLSCGFNALAGEELL